MKKLAIYCLTILLGLETIQAQTDVDALRYSQTTIGGSARAMSIGGAFGALGGDITSMGLNPAGMGMYRKGEFVFTPSLFSHNTKSSFLGTEATDYKYNFNLSNMGVVVVGDGGRNSNWKSFGFGFGYQRIANFNRKDFFHGINTNNSLLDAYVEAGEGINAEDITRLAPFDVGLAYENYLIDPWVTDSSKYIPIIPDGNIQQLQTRDVSGKIDEWMASFGANYNNKLFLGATLGIPYLKYKERSVFQEVDTYDSIPEFNSYTVTNRLTTSGVGINMKIGVQYRATPFLQVGGALHTPTFYSLADRYTSSIGADFDSTDFHFDSPKGEYDYHLFTPMKLIGSIALLSNEFGFITADYEWVDYGSSTFDFTTLSPQEEILEANINQDIAGKYKPASNIRVGAEAKLENFRIRAGYALYGSPFKSGIATNGGDNKRTSISMGVGYRDEAMFVDLAYVRTMTDEYYSPYTLSTEVTDGASQELTAQNFLLSWGFKF